MKKESNKENFTETQQEQLSKLFKDVFGKEDSNINFDEAKELETIKIILASTLNDKYLESLTNLTVEEIDDIFEAYYLNEFFDNSIIEIAILHKLRLSRSKTKESKNLLNILTDIAGKNISYDIDNNSHKGILGRFK